MEGGVYTRIRFKGRVSVMEEQALWSGGDVRISLLGRDIKVSQTEPGGAVVISVPVEGFVEATANLTDTSKVDPSLVIAISKRPVGRPRR